MKKVFTISLGLGLTLGAIGQQLPQLNQFQMNGFMINPAFAGIEDVTDIKTGFRQQWAGFDGAPVTGWISAHTNLGKGVEVVPFPGSLPLSDTTLFQSMFSRGGKGLRHGVGVNLIYDRLGAFDRVQGQVAYSFHFPLYQNIQVALSPAVGLSNHGIRTDEVFMFENNDPLYNQYLGLGQRFTHLDISVGALIYAPKWWVGYTAHQLMQNKIHFGDQPTEAMLDLHHFAMAGVMLPLSNQLEIQVNGLFKLAGDAPYTFDAGARLRWKQLAWIGGGYRHDVAAYAMLGVNVTPCISIAYSYDFPLNQIREGSLGSHEFVLGFRPFNPNRLQNKYLW